MATRMTIEKRLRSSSKTIRRARAIVLIFLGITVILLGLFFGLMATRPTSTDAYVVKLSGSMNLDATTLQQKGIIRLPIVFKLYSRAHKLNIIEGYYSLSGGSLREVVNRISEGPNTNKITFPEGYSVSQMAQKLSGYGVDSSVFYTLAKSKEGMLFPDTYFFDKGITASEVIEKMSENYRSRTSGLLIGDKQLIIASIVEREAKNDSDRSKIAAVYYNRLNQGMKLEADPTVQYARDLKLSSSEGLGEVTFWSPLGPNQVRTIISPYNTYLNSGLPPTPICNPGLKSIEAAVNPEKDFNKLFFFHDGAGMIHFSDSYEEHQSQIIEFGL